VKRYYSILLPGKLLIGRSDFSLVGRRALERITIMGLLFGGCRYLSELDAIRRVNSSSYRTSTRQIRRAFGDLIDGGWLSVVEKGSYHKRVKGTDKMPATSYCLTEKAKQVYLNSNRFYGSLSAFRNRKPLKPQVKGKVKQIKFHDDWRQILPPTIETEEFITALAELESHPVYFDREAAGRSEYEGLIKPSRPMPDHGIKTISYRPLKSGRMQSVPHTYIGTQVTPFIVPADDIDLDKGTLISLDFKSQEFRIIGALVSKGPLFDDLNKYDDIFDHIQKIMPPYLQTMIPTIKQEIYALTYGSKGWSLADKLYENGAPRKVAIGIANDFYKFIYHIYPEVLELKQKCENQLKNTHVMTAIGGVSRYPEQDEGGITKAGDINKLYISRIPLSHTIQGAGATIARKIITKSPKLNFSRLFMPIHDGFIFYTVNDVDMAIREATKLMGKCAREVVDIEMPLKLEWIRSKNMLSYG